MTHVPSMRPMAALVAWLLLGAGASSQFAPVAPVTTAGASASAGGAATPGSGGGSRTLKSGTDGVGGIEKAPPTTGNAPAPWPHVPPSQLPALAQQTNQPWFDLGQALAPVGGPAPRLIGSGSAQGGQPVVLAIDRAPPAAPLALVLGLEIGAAPFQGGLLVPRADVIVIGLHTDAAGRLTLAATMPAGLPQGLLVFMQSLHAGGGAGQPAPSLSNAVALVVP